VKPIGIVGNLSRDRVDGSKPRVGGGPYHCGRALRALGRSGVLVAKSAEADRRELLTPLVCLGLPVRWHAAASTAEFTMRYEGDARTMWVEQLGEPWTPEEAEGWVANALAGIDWVHVAPLARSDFPSETLTVLGRGRRLSFDAHGLVRRPTTGPLELEADYDANVLDQISLLKLAEDEAELLLDGLDAKALRNLGVPEVVVTFGSRGSLVYSAGRLERVTARSIPGEVDPTGAGDAFAAAYVAARASGQAPSSAAHRASGLVTDLLSGRLR
jgi:sugar/nucleoside kinase (ribokinase family)